MAIKQSRYDELLISGKAIFFAEGVDYQATTDVMRDALHSAGKRRGLKVATKVVMDPPGFVFQAYLPTHQRPELPNPTQRVNKKTHPGLFCRMERCDTRLRPKDDERCAAHK